MKRRGFLKFLSIASATYFVALLDAKALRPKAEQVIDWSDNRIARAAGHVRPNVYVGSAQPFNPATSTISYSEYSDAGRMPTYEGFVRSAEGNRLWRFDVTHELTFKCRNCDLVLPFSREDFRQHGQKCNAVFGEQS